MEFHDLSPPFVCGMGEGLFGMPIGALVDQSLSHVRAHIGPWATIGSCYFQHGVSTASLGVRCPSRS